MIIKKIELQGFKSFPDRTKLVLHPGITVIVGPNGTGKSNIVDALLWVLGGKRYRSLRSERGSEIIFNGNTQKAPMSMADVTLTLGDEAEELKINHRYFRPGESEYRLDGKVVRLKDIQDTLWKKSIGEKEYFVIEQGAVGLFLTSKPLEKRVLLEEAAGTAFYKDKKRQAQNKLENSEQNLTRLEDIISEVSRAKNSLKRQANAAVRYRKLREKIRLLTSQHFRKKIDELEKHQEEAVQQYTTSLNKENQATLALKEKESKLAAKRKEVWDLEKSIKKERENLYGFKAQISKTDAEKDKESRRLDFFKEKRAAAEKTRKELQEELKTLEKQRQEALNETDILQDALKNKQASLEEADRESQSMQSRLETQRKKIETLRNKHLQNLSEHTELKNEWAKVEKEKDMILHQEKKLYSQLNKEQELQNQSHLALKNKESEQQQMREQLEAKKLALKASQEDLHECLSVIQQTQEKIDTLTIEKNRMQHQLFALEKLDQTQRIPAAPEGVEDPLEILADLIETDKTHAPLVDILWKEETKASLLSANKLLDLLSAKGIKGNFLLLPSQEKKIPLPDVYGDSRVIGHLKSYIHPQHSIKKRLFCLQDAAVVKNVETAVELWINHPSLNYITTSGDVLFSSGLLKVGEKQKGLMTLSQEKKSLKEKIRSSEEMLLPLVHQVKEKSKIQKDLEKKIQDRQKDAEQLGREIEASEKEKGLAQAEIEKVAANISIIEKEMEILVTDRKILENKLKTLETKSKKTETQEEEWKKTIQDEENKLSSLQHEREQERRQFFELKSETDLLKEKISNLKEQVKALKKRADNGTLKLASLEEEMEETEREIKNITEDIKHLREKAQKQKKELAQKEENLLEEEARLSLIKSEQEDLENRVEELRKSSEARKEERVKWEIRKAERERDLVNLEESSWQELKKTLQEVKQDISLDEIPGEDPDAALTRAQEKLQKHKAVNLMAEEEYGIHKKRYDFLIKERKDLQESIASTKEAIKKIDKESKTQFLKALQEVNKYFKEVFSLLFEGGQAEVKLTDSTQPLESGVDIVAQPPGKRVQSLNLLSGGEKALTSLAFFFALFRYKPTPFCVLDEVDAALDEKNLGRFLNLMKKVKEQTQFLLITHNYKTMEVADYIYGTTMAEPNITSLYSMKLDKKDT
jgi:chromosome segregation protein